MGGYGSGRQLHIRPKRTTSEFRILDIRRLHREGLLVDNCSFRWSWGLGTADAASIEACVKNDVLILSYKTKTRSEQDWHHQCSSVQLDRTGCHLGGARRWFRCPVQGCGRRVAILYASNVFACRHCLDLAYISQREVRLDRLIRRAEKLRFKLGWKPGILNQRDFRKPDQMHWITYTALLAEYDRFEQEAFRGILMQMGHPIDPDEDTK